jgi:hypothetical protein
VNVRRDEFMCGSGEVCYINPVDGGLFCLDESTGELVLFYSALLYHTSPLCTEDREGR